MATNLGVIESCSGAVAMPEPLGNTDIAVTNGLNVVDNLVEPETETLAMEPSSDQDAGGGIVVQESIDDARVSGNEMGTVMETVLDGNEVSHEEKEGQYKAKDLVWGKVKSYPWWPGQIFDPSASTDKARKYSNKKAFLIAYFGDQTFAWNEASKIKPFRKNFCKMEKQSNSKAFCNAVSCALDEVSRRVEFGLACSCLSEEVYGKLKSQVFINAGIRKEASRIDGGDNFSTVATFKAANVVRSVQDLAKEHFNGISRLEVISVRAQLFAFYRWKGYYQLSARSLFDGSDNKLEDNCEVPLMEKDKMVEDAKPDFVSDKVSSKKRKLNACDDVPRKHKNVRKDEIIPSKKEKSSTKVTPNGRSSVPSRENKSKKDGGKRTAVECNDSKEEGRNGVADRKPSVVSPKKLFRVGDSICRIARQLSGSPSIFKKESQKLEATSTEEKHISKSSGKFSSNSRKPVPEKNSHTIEKNDEQCVEKTEENGQEPEVTEAEGNKDNEVNVIDNIVPSSPEERVLSEPVFVMHDPSPKTSSATALVLKFTNLESIPSVTHLNKIFSRYGPVREAETEVLKKNNCAKVVFEAQSNAETAFSSAGKFSLFGPSLISYRLDYSPTLRKTPPRDRKHKKDGKSVKAIQFEE